MLDLSRRPVLLPLVRRGAAHPTDAEIKAAVVDQLRVNRFTKDDDLKVDVKQGVVILGGTVHSPLASAPPATTPGTPRVWST